MKIKVIKVWVNDDWGEYWFLYQGNIMRFKLGYYDEDPYTLDKYKTLNKKFDNILFLKGIKIDPQKEFNIRKKLKESLFDSIEVDLDLVESCGPLEII